MTTVDAIRRDMNAMLLANLMAKNGFRFSKDYRWETTPEYARVYAEVNTVMANNLADIMSDATRYRTALTNLMTLISSAESSEL